MGKKTSAATKETLPPRRSASEDLAKKSIIVQDNSITIAQLFRGNQDIQSWYAGVKAAEMLRNPQRYFLYQTLFDISIDLHLQAMMGKRERAVKTIPFNWDGLDNDLLKENFSSPWFRKLIGLIVSNVFWGPTLAEITIDSYDGLISDCDLIPRQNVMPEYGVISADGMTPAGGIPYREGLYQNYILEIGDKRDLGLLTKIAPYVLMKRMNLADFSRYNEMFGHDLRVYYYDPSKSESKAKVEQSAKEFGTAAYVVLPKGFGDVDFKGSNKQSSAAMYKEMHNILNDEITVGILGQLLTTGGKQGGSFSLGQVHKQVEESINMEDRLMCEYVINYPFKKNILIPHGYPMDKIKGAFQLTEEIPIETKQTMWLNLIDRGFPIATEDVQAEFGIPAPGDKPIFVRTNAAPAVEPPITEPPTPPLPEPQPGGAGKKKQSQLSQRLSAYYKNVCPSCESRMTKLRGSITLSYKDDLGSIIDDIIDRVRSGELKSGSVDQDLYELIASRLFSAVESGFGDTIGEVTAEGKNTLLALRENVYRFSAFKTYHFVLEANNLLKNQDGSLKSFDEFKKDILSLNDEYNINNLRTEYNHAKATSRMAQKWQQFKKDQSTLPLLQYVTAGDERVRASHKVLNGIIKPVDDQFWDTPNSHLPPLAWNCRCTVRQLSDGEISHVDENDLPQAPTGFGYNWGEDKFVFPPDHPQFEVKPGDETFSSNNFGLPLP